MARYVFLHIDLCGVLGKNTPENPGSDYGLLCVISAPNPESALEWGYRIHGDYLRARMAQAQNQHDGSTIRLGELADYSDDEIESMLSERPFVAACSVGEFPVWIEPWKSDSANGVRSGKA